MIGYKQYLSVPLVLGVCTNFLPCRLLPIFFFYHKVFDALFVFKDRANIYVFKNVFIVLDLKSKSSSSLNI